MAAGMLVLFGGGLAWGANLVDSSGGNWVRPIAPDNLPSPLTAGAIAQRAFDQVHGSVKAGDRAHCPQKMPIPPRGADWGQWYLAHIPGKSSQCVTVGRPGPPGR